MSLNYILHVKECMRDHQSEIGRKRGLGCKMVNEYGLWCMNLFILLSVYHTLLSAILEEGVTEVLNRLIYLMCKIFFTTNCHTEIRLIMMTFS